MYEKWGAQESPTSDDSKIPGAEIVEFLLLRTLRVISGDLDGMDALL